MTDTKTKPDGECFHHEKLGWFWRGLDRYESEGMTALGYKIRPVCLVSPALLDWCDSVKMYLEECLSEFDPADRPIERELLDKLKEVRG